MNLFIVFMFILWLYEFVYYLCLFYGYMNLFIIYMFILWLYELVYYVYVYTMVI